jgi:hypothetical protein
MFPHLTMVIHNSASSTAQCPRWRAIIPTTCALSVDAHREIMSQMRQALNRRGFFDEKQLEKRAEKGMAGKCHGFDPSKYNATSMFYLPTQASAGPDASFFLVFEGGSRKAINPHQWIDKTIINHRPDPAPQPIIEAPASPAAAIINFVRKDPKLTRALLAMEAEKEGRRGPNYEEVVNAAIEEWRAHPIGSGNAAFFTLAVKLACAGMERDEIRRTLHAEVAYAHGPKSQGDRRTSIPYIMRMLRCAA